MTVGLGDLARKAYLPTLAARPGLELHLVTHVAAVLENLGRRWRITSLHADIDAALRFTRFDATCWRRCRSPVRATVSHATGLMHRNAGLDEEPAGRVCGRLRRFSAPIRVGWPSRIDDLLETHHIGVKVIAEAGG